MVKAFVGFPLIQRFLLLTTCLLRVEILITAFHQGRAGLTFKRLLPPWRFGPEAMSPDDLISKELSSNDMSHAKVLPKLFQPKDNDTTHSFEYEFDPFTTMFRQGAPYIAMHRGSTIVIHIGGHCLKNKSTFDAIMDDISILHLLGVKLVLVVGVRDQLDERILHSGDKPVYHGGMRVTDTKMLKFLKEESGSARFEIESALAKGFRGTTGQSGISVVSGNFFYTAKPLGVRGGIDFKLTGEVRRIEVDNFRKRLDSGDIVLLTSLGYSNSGEVFNVPSESLAAECAAKLQASKIVYFTEGEGLLDTRNSKPIQSLRLSQATALLSLWNISRSLYNHVEEDGNGGNGNNNNNNHQNDAVHPALPTVETLIAAEEVSQPPQEENSIGAANGFIRLVARCVYSLTGGVKRAHLVASYSGSLLKELYTTDGAGMLISRDMYEGVRPANIGDIRSILEIIRPLEEEGILVPRTYEQLVDELPYCFVMTRDSSVLALGMLKAFTVTHAEVSCLAVHPNFRREGRGEVLLAYLERRALLMGLTHLFVLSTRTMQWFEERGFVLSDPADLPSNRQYNKERGSKVYIKVLGSQRDVEAEELLWNI